MLALSLISVDYAMDHNRFFYILGPQFEPLNFVGMLCEINKFIKLLLYFKKFLVIHSDPDSKATAAEKRIQMEQITDDIYKTLKGFTPKAV